MTVRLRFRARVNPSTPPFDALPPDAEVTFVPLEGVWPGGLDTSRTASKESVSNGYTRFLEGDVLVPKITPTFQADRATIASGLLGGVGAGTTELHVVRCGHLCESRYVRYLFSSKPFLSGGEAELIGVAGQKRVPDAWLRDLNLPIDSVNKQRAIADDLDAETSRLDALIDKKRRMARLLEESFSSWVFAEVTGRETREKQPSSLAWVDWIPSAWRAVPLRYFARLGTGHTPSRTHPEYWVDCNIPWISLFDVGTMRDPFAEVTSTTKQQISDLGLANSSAVLHPAGTVLLSRTASVGFATIMGNEMAVSQHFVTWTCGEDLLPEYLLYVLRAMRQEWESLQVGTTNVTVFMPDLYAVRIPLPPIMEQEKIVARIRRRCEIVRRLLSALENQVGLLVSTDRPSSPPPWEEPTCRGRLHDQSEREALRGCDWRVPRRPGWLPRV